MRYSYKFKRDAVDLYRQGKWPDTPEGIQPKSFHNKVRLWARIEEALGPEALKHHNHNKEWSPEEKLELISRVLAGEANQTVAVSAGISDGMLYSWVRRYKMYGYEGLLSKKQGRPSKEPDMDKKQKPLPLTESEREELIWLRAEIARIKAENEVIKKEIALREARWDEQLKAKKRKSSGNSEKKDTP
jgi:transposase-like protein